MRLRSLLLSLKNCNTPLSPRSRVCSTSHSVLFLLLPLLPPLPRLGGARLLRHRVRSAARRRRWHVDASGAACCCLKPHPLALHIPPPSFSRQPPPQFIAKDRLMMALYALIWVRREAQSSSGYLHFIQPRKCDAPPGRCFYFSGRVRAGWGGWSRACCRVGVLGVYPAACSRDCGGDSAPALAAGQSSLRSPPCARVHSFDSS